MKAYRLLEEGQAREIADDIRHLEWEQGKASTQKATGTTKYNLELRTSPHLQTIRDALKEHALYSEHFISNIWPPKFNWYRDDGEYRIHSDAAFMDRVRTDLACTTFLTDDYDGGELVIGGQSIKGKPGICVVYECWKPHWVNPVTRGDRISAITWMQSHVTDEWKRELLNILHSVAMEAGNQEHFAKLGAVHEKLFKDWMRK
jgi:PKHD-type hydroxylase